MPLYRWAGNYFSDANDQETHKIGYIAENGGHYLRGAVRWMQATFYVDFDLQKRQIVMLKLNLSNKPPGVGYDHPVDLLVTDSLAIYCIVELCKMFNPSVWNKVPLALREQYPTEITKALIYGRKDYYFKDSMESMHHGYAPLMFALLKRCPETKPPSRPRPLKDDSDNDDDDSDDSDDESGGRVDGVIYIKHGDINLGQILWMDDYDTLKYGGSSYF